MIWLHHVTFLKLVSLNFVYLAHSLIFLFLSLKLTIVSTLEAEWTSTLMNEVLPQFRIINITINKNTIIIPTRPIKKMQKQTICSYIAHTMGTSLLLSLKCECRHQVPDRIKNEKLCSLTPLTYTSYCKLSDRDDHNHWTKVKMQTLGLCHNLLCYLVTSWETKRSFHSELCWFDSRVLR